MHHVTSNPSNLSTKSKYIGFEKMHISNESRLFIQHIGSNYFVCYFMPTQQSFPKDVLHVP